VLQGCLRRLRLLPQNKQRLTVLAGCSGALKPGRLTLLLGPPASGKTTLLKALAGKLKGGSLQVPCCGGYHCIVILLSFLLRQHTRHVHSSAIATA
jgi:ABC-type uncharacterized transport system ATPase subunit